MGVRRNGPKKGRDPEGPRLGWYSYGRRAERRWGGSTPRAAATFLAVLLRTGKPRSAFPDVFFETPVSVARSRLVIPRSSRRVFTRSGNSPTYTLSLLVDGRIVRALGEAGRPRAVAVTTMHLVPEGRPCLA